ncbi:hypothetical protein HY213_01315 [Candidatus Peregrinibacteria bacterium]|nr:hypothetical protein [Candidatus Peregrinibacteria bacterium]
MALRLQTTHLLLAGIILLTGIGVFSSRATNLRGDVTSSSASVVLTNSGALVPLPAENVLSSMSSSDPNDGLNPFVPRVPFTGKLLCRPSGKMDNRGSIALNSNDRSLSLRIDVDALIVRRCLGETCDSFAVTRKDFAGNGMTFVNLQTKGTVFPRWSVAFNGGYTETDLNKISFFGTCQALPMPS